MSTRALAASQRQVKVGIAFGTAAYLSILGATYLLRVAPAELPPIAERLGFAVRCGVFSAFMLAA